MLTFSLISLYLYSNQKYFKYVITSLNLQTALIIHGTRILHLFYTTVNCTRCLHTNISSTSNSSSSSRDNLRPPSTLLNTTESWELRAERLYVRTTLLPYIQAQCNLGDRWICRDVTTLLCGPWGSKQFYLVHTSWLSTMCPTSSGIIARLTLVQKPLR